MKYVGDLLTSQALSEADMAIKTLLAKSAFNRYYYHCWIAIRDEILTITELNQQLGHGAGVGTGLKGPYREKIVSALKATDLPERAALEQSITEIFREITKLMKKLYEFRRIADYEQLATIDFQTEIISLTLPGNNETATITVKEFIEHVERISNNLEEMKNIKRTVGLE